MERLFIEKGNAKIEKGSRFKINLELNDKSYKDLEIRSLFPITMPESYIAILDEEGKELAVIKSLSVLTEKEQKVIKETLKEYYMIPKILKVLDREEKRRALRWEVETDRGVVSFEIANRLSDIKTLGTRVIIRDSNDNRYEIPDYEKLDIKSFKKISIDI